MYALDLLGFGKSDKPVLAYNMELWRDQLADFLADFVQEPVVLVGNSLGSLTCLMVCAVPSLPPSLLFSPARRLLPSSPPSFFVSRAFLPFYFLTPHPLFLFLAASLLPPALLPSSCAKVVRCASHYMGFPSIFACAGLSMLTDGRFFLAFWLFFPPTCQEFARLANYSFVKLLVPPPSCVLVRHVPLCRQTSPGGVARLWWPY